MRVEDSLLDLQRAFAAAIREPLAGSDRDATPLAPRPGGPSPSFRATAEALLEPTHAMDAVARLGVYHRQYWYRLLDSLDEDFPALKRFLGPDRFWAVVEAFLAGSPPSSFTLRHLGAGLADFVRVAAGPGDERTLVAADIARLEYAICESFEAGESIPVDPNDLALVRVTLQPFVRLLAVDSCAFERWREPAPRAEDAAPDGMTSPVSNDHRGGKPIDLVAWRRNGRVEVERVDAAAARLLAAFARGCTVEEAIDAAGLDDNATEAARLHDWFALWVARGWLVPWAGALVPESTKETKPR